MIRYSLVLISSLLFSLAAEQVAFPEKGMTPDQSVQKDKATQPDFCFLEARAAYFYPTGHKFREVYSGAGVYGLEFDCRVVKYLYGWVGADYLGKSGKTSAGNSTKITAFMFPPCNTNVCSCDTNNNTKGERGQYGTEKRWKF